MQLTKKLLPAAALTALLLTAGAAQALNLDGGTTTFTFPENVGNKKASISVTNNTKAKICDFVIKVVTPGSDASYNITGASVNDDNQAGESWRVDDNGNGSLDAGEGDAQANPPGEKVRIEEHGKNQCVGRGRTVSLDLEFSDNPRKGDQLKISPTSINGGVIFVSSLPGCASLTADNVLFPTGTIGFTNGDGEPVLEVPLSTSSGVEVLFVESATHGGFYDYASRTYFLDAPWVGEEVLEFDFELDGFGLEGEAATVCFGETVAPLPVNGNGQPTGRPRS